MTELTKSLVDALETARLALSSVNGAYASRTPETGWVIDFSRELEVIGAAIENARDDLNGGQSTGRATLHRVK